MAPTSARTRARACSGGFTLLETVLALALLGLIAALALPRVLPGPGSTGTRIKAFEVAALMRSDRTEALRSGRTTATSVDAAARRVRSGVSGATVQISERMGMAVTADPRGVIRFFADGTSSGGEVLLTGRGAAYAVRVDERTAAVRIGGPGRGG